MRQLKKDNEISGTQVNLHSLIDLRHKVIHQPTESIKKKLTIPGEKLTSIRGCGLEFDATREYQTGDDIRSMAWRVTARSLKPHIKVYREEKERPVWLALDLSPSLYFGTRCMFKSVKMIQQATIVGWTSLIKRERIGAIINSEDKPLIYQPQTNERHYLAILNSLAQRSTLQPSFQNKYYLQNLLLALQQQIRSGHLIYIYSDFFQFDNESERLILQIAKRGQVILNFIYDPFEAFPPPPRKYLITNGQEKLLFDMQSTQNREQYQQQFQMKVQQLKNLASHYNIPFHMHCTDATREINV